MQHNALEERSSIYSDTRPPGTILFKGVLVQLFFTHALTGAIMLIIAQALIHQPVDLAFSIIGIIVCSGALGLLLTANISYELHHIKSMLRSILHGQHATMPAFSWTFTPLFAALRDLDRRVQTYIQGEQEAAEIRNHYLQQASEAATLTERQRIARDLHDSIKQQLFSISISTATIEAYWNKDITRAHMAVADIQRVAKEAQVEMQALLQELSSTPLGSTTLADALRVQAEALKYRSGLETELNLNDIPAAELLPEGAQEMIFRIVQEAFANIARHARAKSIAVTLRQTERALHLIISDNGKGFDANVAHAGMGLTNMRERVESLKGTIDVSSAPGQGTRLHIIIPLIPLETPHEDLIQREQEIRHRIERATKDFQIGSTGQGIALFFVSIVVIGIQIPITVILVCLLVGLYGFLQGYFAKRSLITQKERAPRELLELRKKEEKVWGDLLMTLFVGSCFYLSRNSGWEHFPVQFFVFFFLGVLIVLEIVHQWKRYHTRAEMYRTLDPNEAQLEIIYQRRKVTRIVSILIALGIVIVITQGRLLLGQIQGGMDKWNIIVLTMLFLGVGLYVLFEAIVLRQRRLALAEAQTEVSTDSTSLRG